MKKWENDLYVIYFHGLFLFLADKQCPVFRHAATPCVPFPAICQAGYVGRKCGLGAAYRGRDRVGVLPRNTQSGWTAP